MEDLLLNIRNCTLCKAHLPLGPRPIVFANPDSKIVIVSQAPGTKAHASGIPWDEASGKQLRRWLDVRDEEFFDEKNFAILPIGFCYPGRGKGGDLPPRPECAPKWHEKVWNLMPNVELILLIGAYAQRYYLKKDAKKTLTQTVANYDEYLPKYFPIPHPSPRNQFWLTRNPWYEAEVVPQLRRVIKTILRS
ncbi:uracil-DNA glycosylase [Gelidibacter algens]|uniref:Uracil-DNA glycosylase n=1 Tax=Gelidibacter algens TaxID=49280 RepID=A0A1A7R4B2_9FLAO|nr:uracil-DNA glycosylase family protein [Gelidibacter algens]OBX26691.1 IclR family transcriptional regulator [Gelidibacter algens]RAJ25755.1 uracil-DNA glycosylase [Gelidibacter algens]